MAYVSYGSGSLGFELKLLRYLIPQQFGRISIIIIDPTYRNVHTERLHNVHRYHESKTDTYDNNVSERIATFSMYVDTYISQFAPSTQYDIHVFPHAQAYAQIIDSNPELRADICTWIDPDTPIQPDNPYTENDAQQLPACFQDRACDYILTINNREEPVLLTSRYEYTLTQRIHYTIPTHTYEQILYLNSLPVYPYDPVDEGVQIGETIYDPNNLPQYQDALQLLQMLCSTQALHTICIISYVRNQLDTLSTRSAPG